MEVSKEISMIRIRSNHPNAQKIFVDALKKNEVVAYPTDTIYGIGTNAENINGINKINKIKKRSQPMSVIIHDFNVVKNKLILEQNISKKIEEMLKDGSTFIAKHIPESFNKEITKDGKIGFRIPNHSFLKSVLSLFNKPITTTSINETGQEPLHNPDDIENIFGNKIDLLIDEGIIKNKPSKIYMIDMKKITQIR